MKRTAIARKSAKRLKAEAEGFQPKPRKAMKRTAFKSKRKASGQAAVFREIWKVRPHRCEVCGIGIAEPTASNFSHILPKGTYPDYKLDPRNIVVKCKPCHDLWHQHGASGLRYSFHWVPVVRMYDQLRTELTAKISGQRA